MRGVVSADVYFPNKFGLNILPLMLCGSKRTVFDTLKSSARNLIVNGKFPGTRGGRFHFIGPSHELLKAIAPLRVPSILALAPVEVIRIVIVAFGITASSGAATPSGVANFRLNRTAVMILWPSVVTAETCLTELASEALYGHTGWNVNGGCTRASTRRS